MGKVVSDSGSVVVRHSEVRIWEMVDDKNPEFCIPNENGLQDGNYFLHVAGS